MNRLSKGLICSAASLMATGAGIAGIESEPKITNQSIEACARALEAGFPNRNIFHELPDECDGPLTRAFETTGTEAPDDYYYVLQSSKEFRNRAEEIQAQDAKKLPFRILAALSLGGGVGGIAYYEWAVNHGQSGSPDEHETSHK